MTDRQADRQTGRPAATLYAAPWQASRNNPTQTDKIKTDRRTEPRARGQKCADGAGHAMVVCGALSGFATLDLRAVWGGGATDTTM